MIIAWMRRHLRRRAARHEAAVLIRVFGERALEVSDQEARMLDGADRELARLVGVAVEQQLGLRPAHDWTLCPNPEVDVPTGEPPAPPLDEIAITNSTYPPRQKAPGERRGGIGIARPWPYSPSEQRLPELALTLRLKAIGIEIGGHAPLEDAPPVRAQPATRK